MSGFFSGLVVCKVYLHIVAQRRRNLPQLLFAKVIPLHLVVRIGRVFSTCKAAKKRSTAASALTTAQSFTAAALNQDCGNTPLSAIKKAPD
jgi:hypothetical protein